MGWVSSVGGVRDGIVVAQALNRLWEVGNIEGGDRAPSNIVDVIQGSYL